MDMIDYFVEYLYLPAGAVFIASAVFFAWAAYQVQFRGRVQLIRLGSVALPGAELLKSQFATLFLLQAVASLCSAVFVVSLSALQPGVFIFMLASLALAFRRSVLIGGLEKHAISARNET